MGSSKVVLVGATSLIVGIYSLSIKKVESSYVTASMNRVKMVQLDRAGEAALRLAVNDLAVSDGLWTRSVKGMKVLGSSADYTVSKQGNTYIIAATVSIGGTTKTVQAYVEKVTGQAKKSFRSVHRGQWQVTDRYERNQKEND